MHKEITWQIAILWKIKKYDFLKILLACVLLRALNFK